MFIKTSYVSHSKPMRRVLCSAVFAGAKYIASDLLPASGPSSCRKTSPSCVASRTTIRFMSPPRIYHQRVQSYFNRGFTHPDFPQFLLPRGRCYYTCALLYTPDAYRLPHGRHVCPRAHIIRVDYPADDTCASDHVRHATTDRSTRALPTRGHARPRAPLADRRITNLCVRQSLCYSTCGRWLHVATPAHVCIVYGRSGSNLRALAGRYTT